MTMREFGNPLGDRPPLDELARTDLLLDALAEREEVDFADPRDDALAALLGQWRDDLRWPPASALVSQDEAVAALRAGVAQRRRARRSLAAVGSVAAALLVLSGFGAVVADARPGDLLYGLHAMMFNRSRVSDDQIVLSAKANLAKVEQMIAQGQWAEAQDELAEVSSTVQAVTDGSRRQDLINEVNLLNTKVETRDPNARCGPARRPTLRLRVRWETRGLRWLQSSSRRPPRRLHRQLNRRCRQASRRAPCRTPRPRWQPAPARRHQNPSRAQLTPRWNPPTRRRIRRGSQHRKRR
ncbi:predicted protein [Mycobacterium tuberculosis EAS054]|nr:predicted protein [Mycobacterium tuberculosis EAS054]